MARPLDVIVVGLGAHGAATFHQLARAGQRVLGIDRFHPPHREGSSHGSSRITRLAVGEGAVYVPLAQESHRIWREIEARTGQSIYHATGGLVMGPADEAGEAGAAAPAQVGQSGQAGKAGQVGQARQAGQVGTPGVARLREPGFARNTIAIARACGIRHEVLDSAAIARRFPAFRLQGDEVGYYEPEAGYVRPELAIELQLALGREAGGELRFDDTVVAIEPRAGGAGVTVRTGAGRFEADRVVLATGGWMPDWLKVLAPASWQASTRVYRQVMYWWEIEGDPALFAPGAFPVFIWHAGRGEAASVIYGFPSMSPGGPAVKTATEQYETATTAETFVGEVCADEIATMWSQRMRHRFQGLSGRAVDAVACKYTVTPDHQFLVDRLPDAPQVYVVSACSGHGFKHSAGLGKRVADWVTDGGDRHPLPLFAHRRLEADP